MRGFLPIVAAATCLLLALPAPAQTATTKLKCEFRSEVKIKSLSISTPMPEISFVADKLAIRFDAGEKATFVDEETGAARDVRHVSTQDTDHFIEAPAPGQTAILSVLQPDATGRKIAIWSIHAWGSGNAPNAVYGKPSQRFGSCVVE